jgi:hypothetical protein
MCPLAGANWNNGSTAGVWASNWNNARGNSNDNVGLRADSATLRTWQHDGGAEGDAFLPCAKSSRAKLSGSFGERQAARTFHHGGRGMKRHGNLFDRATSLDALHQGYLDARKSKRATRACAGFERRLGAQLEDLAATLAASTYAPRPYTSFTVHEPKPRIITAPAFRDRVVQHAAYRVIQPLLDARFIAQSFACRPGLGTHAAADYVQAAMRAAKQGSWFLQMDVRRFYYSIDRGILRALYERIIKDARMVNLVMQFADPGQPQGLPIGNLLSQLGALLYLNELDHFVKRELKAASYCRYVDDFVLIGITREQASEHRQRITQFLQEHLNLQVSRFTVAPVRRGINFCGYRTWPRIRFVRRRALWAFRAAVRAGKLVSAVSSLAHARRTASHQHMLAHMQTANPPLYQQLPKTVLRLRAPAAHQEPQ